MTGISLDGLELAVRLKRERDIDNYRQCDTRVDESKDQAKRRRIYNTHQLFERIANAFNTRPPAVYYDTFRFTIVEGIQMYDPDLLLRMIENAEIRSEIIFEYTCCWRDGCKKSLILDKRAIERGRCENCFKHYSCGFCFAHRVGAGVKCTVCGEDGVLREKK